jgi:protein-S-isoprenylcysteine O-methyltransferase Ste14
MSSSLPWLKAVEVLVVVVAGAAFVWWQWRDVTRAQEQSRREREAREAKPSKTETPT